MSPKKLYDLVDDDPAFIASLGKTGSDKMNFTVKGDKIHFTKFFSYLDGGTYKKDKD